MNGTVTAWVELLESWAVIVAVPTPSLTVWAAAVKLTVGTWPVMVRVWTVVAPRVALVGVPRVTITVSSGSATASATTVTVMVPVVLPAGIVSGLAVMV